MNLSEVLDWQKRAYLEYCRAVKCGEPTHTAESQFKAAWNRRKKLERKLNRK